MGVLLGQSSSILLSSFLITMKVLLICSLVAAISAAPTKEVLNSGPITSSGTWLSSPTFYSSGSHVLPSTFVSGSYPISYSGLSPLTYSSGVSYAASHPITTYSAASPIVYSAPSAVVAPAVVPKSVAQTKGSSHIVY